MTALTVQSGMLIRRSPQVVQQAFVDPSVTTKFWFTDATGPLVPGAVVTWTWAMYGASTRVRTKAVEAARLLVEWDIDTAPSEIEWLFSPRGEHCFVEVENRVTEGDAAKAMDLAGGFALVLGAAKIWLEHGIDPRFIVDRHPDHRVPGWAGQS